MLLDFYACCQWNSFAWKMASLALHQNPRKTKEPSKKMAIKSDRWIRRIRRALRLHHLARRETHFVSGAFFA
jgi:hypothetical protein